MSAPASSATSSASGVERPQILTISAMKTVDLACLRLAPFYNPKPGLSAFSADWRLQLQALGRRTLSGCQRRLRLMPQRGDFGAERIGLTLKPARQPPPPAV